jgi:nondiscriminating aspartyl-tRNA synthetase
MSLLSFLENFDETNIGIDIKLQGRVHIIRQKNAKLSFIILREKHRTIQLVLFGEEINKKIASLTLESIIEVIGKVAKCEKSVDGCYFHRSEIQVTDLSIVSQSASVLPIQVYNASILPANIDTKLKYRVMDLRSIENQAFIQIQSLVCKYFRKYVDNDGFTEIHTPKMISASSESGANVFKIDYFGKNYYLAQSPQLFKQMMINTGIKRVFEIGPVFRAEKSTGPRHLTEFTGIDIEMEIENNYEEVIHMLYDIIIYIFDSLKNHQDLLSRISTYQPLVYPQKPVIIDYHDAIKYLEEDGYKVSDKNDMNIADERALGDFVKKQFNTDIFILNKFPTNIRPFYSMPNEENNNVCNAYDIIFRGNEILSGSQRINDYQMLIKRMNECGINMETMTEYVDSFKFGSPKHGGGGFGLERIVMFFLGMNNVKLASLFPKNYTGEI